MKVGVYFDMRNPPAWRQDWSRLYGFTLEMCQEAEHLGIDSVWTSEHHLFDDGYLTQPLTMLARSPGRFGSAPPFCLRRCARRFRSPRRRPSLK